MKKNAVEWTVFAVSLALTAAVLGALLYEHITAGSGPARLEVTVGAAVASGTSYAVPVDVRNAGDTTAEDVQVSVALIGGAGETSEVTLPYVPYRSERRGWVVFSRKPSPGQLEARVLGYREP